MRRIILLSTVLFATPFGMESYAADCATTSCQTLGYTATSNKGNCLQCPFGNYWFCPKSQCDSSYQYTCTGYMQSPSGTACNGKYQKCNCSNNYVWNASQGKCLACTSKCTNYPFTFEQAVQICGSSNLSHSCWDECKYKQMYNCAGNTGAGGSSSGSGSSGIYRCCPSYYVEEETGCSSKPSTQCSGVTCYRLKADFAVTQAYCTGIYCDSKYIYGTSCTLKKRNGPSDPWVDAGTASNVQLDYATTGLSAPQSCKNPPAGMGRYIEYKKFCPE